MGVRKKMKDEGGKMKAEEGKRLANYQVFFGSLGIGVIKPHMVV